MTTAAPLRESRAEIGSGERLLYAAVIFAGAFLLFQIQPIMGKVVLPLFGGTAAVWTTCMLFFQVFLLAGYSYADWTVRHLRPRNQALLHVALLGAAVLLPRMLLIENHRPDLDPTFQILALLGAGIGLPYFLLSATGPLVQAWYARCGAIPYRLYALSNAGSMLALLSYPVIVEPLLPTRVQTALWSAAYVVFAALCGAAALLGSRRVVAARAAAFEPAPRWRLRALWVALAACPSVLLLSVTEHLSKNVAPIPFLWVLPLSLYLLSFILCFEGHRWRRREWSLRLLLASFAAVGFGMSKFGAAALTSISIFSGALFICCMVCHGELAHLRPHPAHLTSFYLSCSLGGALGGIFAGLVAPRMFGGPYELVLAQAGCLLVPVLALVQHPSGAFAKTTPAQARFAVGILGAVLAGYVLLQIMTWGAGARVTARNFYGALRVTDSQRRTRTLTHGIINHGEQFLDAARRRQPTAYYGPESGGGLALIEAANHGPQRVGLIGLGAGVLATYGRPGDSYRFYEINPLVIKLARTEFTFLQDSQASVDVVLGDGRLALESEPDQHFDVLAVDAFSGDSVPVHLLTKEAFDVYFRHLKTDGVLALHLSSTYLDLAPVTAAAARALRKEARVVDSGADEEKHISAARWVLITGRDDFFSAPSLVKAARPIPERNLRLWTDDYSNMLGLVR